MDRSLPAGRVANPDDILAHYGVKGMKWGVRRSDNKSSKPQIKQKTESRSVTLKNGDTLTLQGDPTPGLVKLISRVSKNMRERANNSSNFTIKDKQGKAIGEMSLYRESPTSLNVVWVGVKDSARGNGYASAAMDSAISLAREQGLKKVTLEVPGNAPDARHIYEKKGFKEVYTPPELKEDDPIWGGLTNMELSLKHSQRPDDILAHYGIKGMRWGVRRANPSGQPSPSSDHDTAKAAKQKVKAGGIKSLTNDELKTYLERMDLEKRYKKSNPTAKDETTKFIKDTLLQVGKQEAAKFVGKQVAKALAGRG